MNKYECPEKIYKYVSFNGLIKTLEMQTFRLSKPSDFNDPFDMNIQESHRKDTPDFLEDLKKEFHDYVSKKIDPASLPDGPLKNKIALINFGIRQASPKQKELLQQEMLNTPIEYMYDLERIERINQEVISFVQQGFKTDAVFCSTTDFSNLLMWAHYAEQHMGAVLEFTPNKEKDSVFLNSKPIQYTNKRPLLYATAKDMVRHSLELSPEESAKIILDGLVFTKSVEWKYENEYRLYIPFMINNGQSFATLRYQPEELTSIFLGCRMSKENKDITISRAKRINPNVLIKEASIHPREFSLDFLIAA